MSENVDATPEVAEKQQADNGWPKPGDEGYVHPDGTPQSVRQLEDNRRAAADRAASGSTVHGAPMATPGPQVADEAERARKRAREYSGPSDVDRDRGLTEFVVEKSAQAAEEATSNGQPAEPTPADRATQRTATTDKGKTTR